MSADREAVLQLALDTSVEELDAVLLENKIDDEDLRAQLHAGLVADVTDYNAGLTEAEIGVMAATLADPRTRPLCRSLARAKLLAALEPLLPWEPPVRGLA